MKSISTLIADIQARLTSGKSFDAETVSIFSQNLAAKLANRLSEERGSPSLRMSNLGAPCDRKLWYSINRPDWADPLSAATRLKFLFGDIIEEVMLFLARAAGHTVTDEQAEVSLHGVTGHIDGVVDGELVDVKSASSYGFKKFQEHNLVNDDPFGYLTQLDGYLSSLDGNSNVLNRDRAHFLAVEKQLGKLTLDTYPRQDVDYKALIEKKRAMLASTTPPPRAYSDEADGKSGNRKLGVACSYCAFKSVCWPGLRTFAYSRGPVFLTNVARIPDVIELTGTEMEE